MTATLADPITVLEGMPFLDDGFAAKRLLAAAAALRHVEGESTGMASGLKDSTVEAWLAPSRVVMLRRNSSSMPAQPLDSGRRARVTVTLDRLCAANPPWTVLLRLPVRFALLYPSGGAISASSRAWPQHVLLADEAFATDAELAEQVVHELCHQWLYLIQEVWALEAPQAESFVLPSGTARRTPSEVLGAAHVAAALIRMYQAVPARSERIEHLHDYGTRCLALLLTDHRHRTLTDAGQRVAQRLKEAL